VLTFFIFCGIFGQAAETLKLVANAERAERLKRLLSPIHLSDPIAPIVREGLEKRVTLSFENMPLPLVVEQLAPLLGGNISISELHDEDGKSLATPTVTYRCRQKTLADALDDLLAPYSLRIRFAHEGVEICDRETHHIVDEWRIYPIPDLVGAVENDDIQMLMAIQETIAKDTWECNGGDGHIIVYPRGFFVVGNNAEVHRKIAEYFALRRLSLPPGSSTRDVGVLGFGEGASTVGNHAILLEEREFGFREVDLKLSMRHDFNIKDARLEDAASQLERVIGIPVCAAFNSVEGKRKLQDSRVSIVRRGIQGRTALKVLQEAGERLSSSETWVTFEPDLGASSEGIRHSWRAYPPIRSIWERRLGGFVRDEESARRFDFVLSDYANRCFSLEDPPELVTVDFPFASGHLLRAPRREHRRFEELYAGIREALRRRDEINRLAAFPQQPR